MGNTSSAHKISAQDRAILDLKTQRDTLHKYQTRITTLLAHETSLAKLLLARDDKPRALLALRRKKYQESLLAKTDAQLAALQQLVADVEFAQVQKDVVFGLQQGTKVLRLIREEMGGLDRVERVLEQAGEMREWEGEVGRMLAGGGEEGYGLVRSEEEEVDAEMAALEREVRLEMPVRASEVGLKGAAAAAAAAAAEKGERASYPQAPAGQVLPHAPSGDVVESDAEWREDRVGEEAVPA